MSETAVASDNRLVEAPEAKIAGVRLKALESWDWYFDHWVGTNDAFEGWQRLEPLGIPLVQVNWTMLRQWRWMSKRLFLVNPFAENGIGNLENFVVGTGFTYKIQDRNQRATYKKPIQDAHDYWEAWCETNNWPAKERELVRRKHRDGEFFMRFFGPEMRFIDPDQVRDNQSHPGTGISTSGWTGAYTQDLGIVYDEKDAQKVLGYFYDPGRGELPYFVPAEEVIHVKANVDSDVPRGIPTFLSCVKPLERALKLSTTMSKMAEVQAAIAVVREHPEGTSGTTVRNFVDRLADRTPTDPGTGNSVRQKQLQPGTMLDVPAGQKYHFPIAARGADELVVVMDAQLRVAAARVHQPEFIFSMNASNSNYASLVAAEVPGLKAFEVEQADLANQALRPTFRRVILAAVERGDLSSKLKDPSLKWKATGPRVRGRDRFQQVRADKELVMVGAMSRRTMADRDGVDLDEEQASREQDGDEKIVVDLNQKSQVGGATGKTGGASK